MHIDQDKAAGLGFPKACYRDIERERRWLCRDFPRDQARETFEVRDVYVTGTRLRLREMRPSDGRPATYKLTRKADADARTRLLTTIYLPEGEFSVLRAALPGAEVVKVRHRLQAPAGVLLSVDEFQGPLVGLVLIEAELRSEHDLAEFPKPELALREVTDDTRYCGFSLATLGLPPTP